MSWLRDRAAGGGMALALILALVQVTGPVQAAGPTVQTPARERTDDAVSVLVLPMIVSGELAGGRQQQFEDTLRQGLRRGGFMLRSAEVEGAGEPLCETLACQVELGRAVGARYVVAMRIEVDRRDYEVTLDVVDTEDGTSVAQSKERCEVCGLAEVIGVIDSQAAAVSTRLDALALEPPTITFDSVPRGVKVRIDGEFVGETPFERVVDPGTHRVRAEKLGFIAEEREIQAVAGVHARLGFELEREPVSDATIRTRRRIWGWVALGGGAAALVTGVSLIAIHDRPDRTRCSGSNEDADGDCKFVYATRIPGVVTGLLGLGLLATGVGLVLRNRRRDRSTASRMGLEITPRSVSIRGHF